MTGAALEPQLKVPVPGSVPGIVKVSVLVRRSGVEPKKVVSLKGELLSSMAPPMARQVGVPLTVTPTSMSAVPQLVVPPLSALLPPSLPIDESSPPPPQARRREDRARTQSWVRIRGRFLRSIVERPRGGAHHGPR